MGYDDLSYPRFRGLGLLDDEEEQLRRRRAELGQLAPLEAFEPTAAPARPTASSLMPERDEGMDSQWRQAEEAALSRSGFLGQPSYGVAEGIRDFAPMAIGGALDIALNKGRGLGVLTAGGMQALTAERARRDREADDAGKYALAVRRQREAGGGRPIAAQNAVLRGEEIDLERARLDQQRAKLAGGDPESAARTNLAEAQAYQLWTKDPSALTPEQQAMNEDRDAMRADRKEERGERRLDREEARAQRLQQQGIVNQRAAETRDEVATNKFLDKTDETRAQATQLKNVEPIVDNPAYAKDLPGVGMVDSRMPSWLMHPIDPKARQDADSVQKLTAEAGQYFKHEITGAASTDREQTLLMHIKGLEPGATEEQFRQAITFWKKDLQDKLKARATASPGPARRALDAQGLGQWTYGDEESPPDPSASIFVDDGAVSGPVGRPAPLPPMGQRFDGRPDTSGDLSDLQNETLPSLGGTSLAGRDTPDFPGGATRSGARMRNISMPGKPPLQKLLTDEDAERLRAAGAQVQ